MSLEDVHTHTYTHTHTRGTTTIIKKQSAVTTPLPRDPLQSILLSTLLHLPTLSLQTALYLLEFYIEMESCNSYSFVSR